MTEERIDALYEKFDYFTEILTEVERRLEAVEKKYDEIEALVY